MSYQNLTHQMGAGAGDVIALSSTVGFLRITTHVANLWVRPTFATTAPTNPPADPTAPGVGNSSSGWIELLAAGDYHEQGADPDGKGYVIGLQDPINYVEVWAVGAGFFSVHGH